MVTKKIVGSFVRPGLKLVGVLVNADGPRSRQRRAFPYMTCQRLRPVERPLTILH